MTNEFPMGWAPDRIAPAAPGWYRVPSGELRYWNGRRWSGLPASAPGAEARGVALLNQADTWRVAIFVLGWLATVLSLGMVLHGVEVGSVDCGTVFGRFAAAGDRACSAALDSRAISAGVTAALAGLSFLAVRALDRRSRTQTRVPTHRTRASRDSGSALVTV